MSDQRVPITGSAPNQSEQIRDQPRWSLAVNPDQKAGVTVTLRRRPSPAAAQMEEQLLSGQAGTLSREQAAEAISADPRDMAAVRAFLEQQGLTITSESLTARTLKAEGTVAQMEKAFSTHIGWIEDSAGNRSLSYLGNLSIPQSLDGIIVSVIGLDQRTIARAHGTGS
jgi:hypothetical protein